MPVLLLVAAVLIALAVWLVRRGGRGRFFVLNSLIVAVSLAAVAAGTEVFLRFFYPNRFHPLVPSAERGLFWQHDPDLGWRHRPGATGRFRKAGSFDTLVTINSRGFRGREYAEEPPPGVRRIVVLGDSIVWGYGVEDDETFTHLLEAADPSLEVINLGVSGYGTDQESLLLESEGMRYEPDLVLAEVCENDFYEIATDQVYHIYPKPAFRFRAGELVLTNAPVPGVSPLDRGLFWMETHSYLWRCLTSSRAGGSVLVSFKGLARTARLSRAGPPPRSRGFAESLMLALLDRTRRIAEGGGARLALFVVAPMPAPHRELVARFGRERSVPVLDLNLAFGEALSRRPPPTLFLPRDLHWTATGHELVAETVRRWIAGEGLLDAPPSAPETAGG